MFELNAGRVGAEPIFMTALAQNRFFEEKNQGVDPAAFLLRLCLGIESAIRAAAVAEGVRSTLP